MVPIADPWTAIAAAGLGLAIGLRHAFEPDHLMAVATLVAGQRDAKTAMRFGASWGVGHMVSLLIVGSVLAVARASMPESIATLFEMFVAVMVVVIGVRAVYQGWRLGRTGPLSMHAHGSRLHTHETSGTHVHLGPLTLARQPLLVGLIHGLAGSGALTALAIGTLPTLSSQVLFMLLFGLGSTAGMAAVAGLAGLPLARVVQRPGVAATLSIVTGGAAIVFGVRYGQPILMTLLLR